MKNKIIVGTMLFSIITAYFYSRPALAEGVNSISLLNSYAAIDGDWKRFRQNLWMERHFTGGIEDLSLTKDLGDGKTVTVGGRALSDNDFNFSLDLTKEEFGYMKLSYDEFRKYYDDSGPHHVFRNATLPSSFELNKDLHTDRSFLTLDFGLNLPDRPKYTLGFERRTKRGEMALGLGTVRDTVGTSSTTDDDVKFLYPWSTEIEWVVDALKAGTEFKLKGINVALNERLETFTNKWYSNNVYELRDNTFPPYERLAINNEPSYKASTTTLLANSQVNEKLYATGGYLFKALNGRAEWERNYYQSTGALWARYYDGEQSSELNSNIFTWGLNFKPLKDVFLTTRFRYENTENENSSQYTTDGQHFSTTNFYNGVRDSINRYNSEVDKSSFGESIGLEYRALPRTTLYADVEWEQSEVKYLETSGGVSLAGPATVTTFWRDSHVDFNKDTYTVGVNSRPIRPLFISGRYRRINKNNNYTEYTDTQPGYPGWIGDNSRITDEWTLRTDIKPNRLIAFNFKFRDSRTNYDVSKEITTGIGTFDTQTTSLGLTLTPTAKLYINTLYSFQDSMLKTKVRDASVSSQDYYNGDYNSSITTVNYALNDKTTLSSQYTRWAADEEDELAQGLSLGVERSLKKDLLLKAGYSYYTYDNNENTGIDDYKANVIYASLTGKF